MRRREFITLLGGAAVAWPLAARAQQGERKRRVGVLMGLSAHDAEAQDRIAAFVQGLQQLGWTDGRNLQIDYRPGAGDTDLTRGYAAELVALAPDVILASGGTVVGPLLQATRTVPIVFTQTPDPVAAGFVASLARPGGNATGFTTSEYGISEKWLELLKEIAPGVTRAAVLRDPTIPAGIGQFASIQSVAQSLGVGLSSVDMRDATEIERDITAFARGAKAAPDGYTLLIGHTGTLAANGAFYSKLPYDPVNDFEYIGSLGDAPQILIAKKGTPSTLREFAEHVKANQTRMNYGTAGIGSAAHLGGAMLNVALGTQVQPVHYRSIAPAMNDLVGGQIDYMVDMSTTAIPQIQGGSVLPIAVMRSQRLSVLSAVPTSVETGVINLDVSIWNVMMVPKNTPRPIIDSLNVALRKAVAEPTVKASLATIAVEMPDDNRMSPEGARTFVKSERERWVPALKKAGIIPTD